MLNRRIFFQTSLSAALAAPVISGCNASLPSGGGSTPGEKYAFAFLHGVASGDPLAERVILWTRITAKALNSDAVPEQVQYRYQVALDPQLKQLVASGSGQTDSKRDYTVKVDVEGLNPDTNYYYVFQALGHVSDVGRTKTLPVAQVEQVRFACCSCANYPYGYFNVYAAIAQRSDIDLVIHLGDYLYEYANGEYGDGTALNRVPAPNKEMVSLSDYRSRHAQYKTDPDLQAAHQQHPFIVVWDDHETTNDSWFGGADNHNEGEGSWFVRKQAAIKAYMEWMPIRENPVDQERISRQFNFGDLFDLFMLDTRLYGREEQTSDLIARNKDDRSLLGWDQEQWLYDGLSQSKQRGSKWRFLGQQVMMAQLISNELPFNPDQWDGYPAARGRLFSHLKDNAIDNMVVLTGDIHSSWASDLATNPLLLWEYNPYNGDGSLGVEFVTPAVTSPGLDNPALAAAAAKAVNAVSPHIKYVDWYHRGYLVVDVTPEQVQGEWYHMATIKTRSTEQWLAASYKVEDGKNHLHKAEIASQANQVAAAAPQFKPLFKRA